MTDFKLNAGSTDTQSPGWSKSGTLVAVNSPNKTVQTQFSFPEAGTYTVQFTIEQLLDSTLIRGPQFCDAYIEWSVAGNTIYRKISVTNGASISGVGESVKVSCKDATLGTVDPSQESYDVTINIAKGLRAVPSNPVILTDPDFFGLFASGTHIFDVPENAGINSVQVLSDQTVTIAQFPPTGTTPLAAYTNVNAPGFQPLMPGTSQMKITTPAATHLSIIFGVDG